MVLAPSVLKGQYRYAGTVPEWTASSGDVAAVNIVPTKFQFVMDRGLADHIFLSLKYYW